MSTNVSFVWLVATLGKRFHSEEVFLSVHKTDVLAHRAADVFRGEDAERASQAQVVRFEQHLVKE